MMKKLLLALAAIAVVLTVHCDGEGNFTLKLTDAPIDLEGKIVETVNVTLQEIKVRSKDANEGSWVTVVDEPREVDLMQLLDGATTELAEMDLEAGEYTEIRVIVADDNTITFEDDDTTYGLKIPSGTSSGIKIKTSFTIEEGNPIELTLDFDAAESVSDKGSDADYKLDPVIKVKEVKEKNKD